MIPGPAGPLGDLARLLPPVPYEPLGGELLSALRTPCRVPGCSERAHLDDEEQECRSHQHLARLEQCGVLAGSTLVWDLPDDGRERDPLPTGEGLCCRRRKNLFMARDLLEDVAARLTPWLAGTAAGWYRADGGETTFVAPTGRLCCLDYNLSGMLTPDPVRPEVTLTHDGTLLLREADDTTIPQPTLKPLPGRLQPLLKSRTDPDTLDVAAQLPEELMAVVLEYGRTTGTIGILGGLSALVYGVEDVELIHKVVKQLGRGVGAGTLEQLEAWEQSGAAALPEREREILSQLVDDHDEASSLTLTDLVDLTGLV